MPETRYVEVYDNQGHVIAREPYEVSDEELHQEELAHQANDGSHQLLDAYNAWDTLTAAQKRELVQGLLWQFLYKAGML